MLIIYTILYFVSACIYYWISNYIASVVMISLAIFLYVKEVKNTERVINVRGLFALGFIGGFGVSLLKLSSLSARYNVLTFVAVFLAYFGVYLGSYYENRNKKLVKNDSKYVIEKSDKKVLPQDILIISLFVATFISFVIEVIILKYIPLFTIATPHAYSEFHVFMLHYITTFYSFIPCIALCNYYIEPDRKMNKIWLVASYVYVVIMALLMVSRSRLILCIILSVFIMIIYRGKDLRKKAFDRKSLIKVILAVILFLALYIVITVARAHDIEYLNGIFDMKNKKMPIFITQPYMYISQNFENLNYMINNIFRFTFGRRVLYPLFTLTFVKKFFPIVLDSPTYVIKEELSTVTIIYDFYYDFGLLGILGFCFLIGYIGAKLENKTYSVLSMGLNIKNNYTVVLFSLYCYFMLFSFFQTYFSLTDTWVYIIILLLLSAFVTMKKEK